MAIGIFAVLLLVLSTSGTFPSAHAKNLLTDITYEELHSLDLTCNSLDNCERNRTDDLTLYNCDCGPHCSHLDTCCVDSAHRSEHEHKETNIQCLKAYGEKSVSVFMANSCNRSGDEFVQSMCSGEAENDPFKLTPVTSLRTGITYKNYFCAACNDDAGLAAFWDLKLFGNSEIVSNLDLRSLEFDATLQSWAIRGGSEDGSPLPVSVGFTVPETMKGSVRHCRPGVISKCSNSWREVETEKKCLAYMAIVVFQRNESTIWYRNTHCAICNFENVDDFKCFEQADSRIKVADTFFVGLFSLDERTPHCRDNTVYDSYAKKCRAVRCGKNQVWASGKCE